MPNMDKAVGLSPDRSGRRRFLRGDTVPNGHQGALERATSRRRDKSSASRLLSTSPSVKLVECALRGLSQDSEAKSAGLGTKKARWAARLAVPDFTKTPFWSRAHHWLSAVKATTCYRSAARSPRDGLVLGCRCYRPDHVQATWRLVARFGAVASIQKPRFLPALSGTVSWFTAGLRWRRGRCALPRPSTPRAVARDVVAAGMANGSAIVKVGAGASHLGLLESPDLVVPQETFAFQPLPPTSCFRVALISLRAEVMDGISVRPRPPVQVRQ